MTTPNRIVFQATGKPPEIGDFAHAHSGAMLLVSTEANREIFSDRPAYRRIDTPAPDSRLLEVATKLAVRMAHPDIRTVGEASSVVTNSLTMAHALIAACEGAAQ